ncbi:hypothetical protein Pfo_006622 [Paulownia fortunei]|nr:hypothetical protein Pfo_006622 [Paulownia fortunei]
MYDKSWYFRHKSFQRFHIALIQVPIERQDIELQFIRDTKSQFSLEMGKKLVEKCYKRNTKSPWTTRLSRTECAAALPSLDCSMLQRLSVSNWRLGAANWSSKDKLVFYALFRVSPIKFKYFKSLHFRLVREGEKRKQAKKEGRRRRRRK